MQSGSFVNVHTMPVASRGYGFQMDGDEGAQELTWFLALSGAWMLQDPMKRFNRKFAPQYGMGIRDPSTVYGKHPPPGWRPPKRRKGKSTITTGPRPRQKRYPEELERERRREEALATHPPAARPAIPILDRNPNRPSPKKLSHSQRLREQPRVRTRTRTQTHTRMTQQRGGRGRSGFPTKQV